MQGSLKQLIDPKRKITQNQQIALLSIMNIIKSYYIDMVYPDEILQFQSGIASKNDPNSFIKGSVNDAGTRGTGSLKQVIKSVISKVCMHILRRYYFRLTELIIDNTLDDLYMLPVYLLQFAF